MSATRQSPVGKRARQSAITSGAASTPVTAWPASISARAIGRPAPQPRSSMAARGGSSARKRSSQAASGCASPRSAAQVTAWRR